MQNKGPNWRANAPSSSLKLYIIAGVPEDTVFQTSTVRSKPAMFPRKKNTLGEKRKQRKHAKYTESTKLTLIAWDLTKEARSYVGPDTDCGAQTHEISDIAWFNISFLHEIERGETKARRFVNVAPVTAPLR